MPCPGESAASQLAEGAKGEVVKLLLECLCAGGKTWANWVQTHTSSKALNFSASVNLLGTAKHKCTLQRIWIVCVFELKRTRDAGVVRTGELARTPHTVRSRMDRGKIITSCAEIRHFHQRELEAAGSGSSGQFPAGLLRSGLKACEAIDADPTGAEPRETAVLFSLLVFAVAAITLRLICCRAASF